nr:MAG TPA: hypothetical protein [Caudoviricetes sp.]
MKNKCDFWLNAVIDCPYFDSISKCNTGLFIAFRYN